MGSWRIEGRDVAASRHARDRGRDAARVGRGAKPLRCPFRLLRRAEASLARGPPDGESTPRRHGGAGPPHGPRADCVPPHRPPAWRRDGLSRPEHPRQRSDRLRRAHARGQPGKETAPAANRQAHKSARCSGLWRADQRRRSASEGGPSQYPNMPWSPPAAAALSASPAMVSTAAPPSSRWSSRRRRHECDAGARE